MPVQNTTREQKERTLRARFQSPEALHSDEDPLVRLGALYHLAQKADLPEGQQKLRELLAEQSKLQKGQKNQEDFLFFLHTAVILAQHGAFEGVQSILRQLQTAPTREEKSLAERALRNCSQFPLAVLLAQSLELGRSGIPVEKIEPLMRRSEDDLVAIARDSEEDQLRYLSVLTTQIKAMQQLPQRVGRKLALATVISWPIQKDFGYRYTGFVSVERGQESPLIIPYDLADVLNRDERIMQRRYRAVLRAILVYNTTGEHEAEVLYILPFAPLSESETEELMTQLALRGEGLDIAIVVDRWADERGKKYRLLTASGHTTVEFYHAEQQKKGNIFLVHSLNSKPLSTRYQVSDSTVSQVVHSFIQNTELDQATEAYSWKNQHFLVSRHGNTITWSRELNKDFVYLVEGNGRYTFVSLLLGASWKASDRSSILQSFFEKRRDTFGVVLEAFKTQNGTIRVYAVRAENGERKAKTVEEPVQPGTVVYWTKNDKNEFFPNLILDQQVKGGCPHCYGTLYRMCVKCSSKGRVQCPECRGARFTTCLSCGGDGQESCGHCDGGQRTITCHNCGGTGTWTAECKNCGGSGTYTGTCKVCQGTGSYADSGRTCKACGGDGSFAGTCRKCSGTGSISGTCRRCEGSGERNEECRTCRGTGLWNCHDCHGKGKITCDCDTGYVTCPTCDGSRISHCNCEGINPGKIVPV